MGELLIIITLISSYLLGSIPSALIIGKRFYNIDVREHGSGNLGATNTFRTLGKKAGIAVSVADVLKGSVAVMLPLWLNIDIHPLMTGTLAILGHAYPVFANFKGGKSVATTAGVFLAIEPITFVIAISGFSLALKLTKFVSFSSITSTILVSFYAMLHSDVYMQMFTICLSAFIMYKHRANLKRIKERTEPKINWV